MSRLTSAHGTRVTRSLPRLLLDEAMSYMASSPVEISERLRERERELQRDGRGKDCRREVTVDRRGREILVDGPAREPSASIAEGILFGMKRSEHGL